MLTRSLVRLTQAWHPILPGPTAGRARSRPGHTLPRPAPSRASPGWMLSRSSPGPAGRSYRLRRKPAQVQPGLARRSLVSSLSLRPTGPVPGSLLESAVSPAPVTAPRRSRRSRRRLSTRRAWQKLDRRRTRQMLNQGRARRKPDRRRSPQKLNPGRTGPAPRSSPRRTPSPRQVSPAGGSARPGRKTDSSPARRRNRPPPYLALCPR